MPEPFIGEIRLFAGNFAPAGWAFCDGQLLSISEFEPLFILIGTTYGGDGESTFALPDLRGRVPIHQGQGFSLGQPGGLETVSLAAQQLPPHSHALMASMDPAISPNPQGQVLARTVSSTPFFPDPNPAITLAAASVSPTGGNQPHDNVQPFQCLNFIIALQGIFPSQT